MGNHKSKNQFSISEKEIRFIHHKTGMSRDDILNFHREFLVSIGQTTIKKNNLSISLTTSILRPIIRVDILQRKSSSRSINSCITTEKRNVSVSSHFAYSTMTTVAVLHLHSFWQRQRFRPHVSITAAITL